MRGSRTAHLRAVLAAAVVAVGGLAGVGFAPPGGAAGDPELRFESVVCAEMGSVPANRLAEGSTTLDETAGRYLAWSPEQATHPVTGYLGASLPEGCRLVPNVRFRLTSSTNGEQLRPRAAAFVPVGGEDGAVTSRTAATGTGGVLVVRRATLPAEQQAALAEGGGGLWVSAELPGAPWSFANLSCHYDHMNADNLEVVRPSGPGPAVCVLFLTGPVAGPPISAPIAAPVPGPTPGGPWPTVPPPATPSPSRNRASKR
ncbi:MAG: hypothetical protein GEV08_21310 [Acidimicrobiia bacterium]|nr:hypothetical protein [Acidimicrobiia bacterium]